MLFHYRRKYGINPKLGQAHVEHGNVQRHVDLLVDGQECFQAFPAVHDRVAAKWVAHVE